MIATIIPARYDSSRFPGKPLADLLGKPMIQHVYERVITSPLVDLAVSRPMMTESCAGVSAFGGARL